MRLIPSLISLALLACAPDAPDAALPDAAPLDAALPDAAPPPVALIIHPIETTPAPRAFEIRFKRQGEVTLHDGPRVVEAPLALRGCRGDRLSLDLPAPAEVDPVLGPVDLTEPLRARLQEEVEALRFMAPSSPQGAPWLWIGAEDLCEALGRVQAAAAEVAGVAPEAVQVSRLCPIGPPPSPVEAAPPSPIGDLSEAMGRWHLDLLNPDEIPPPALADGAAHLALIGPGAGLQAALGETLNPFEDSRRLESAEGIIKRGLIRQIAPGASLEIHDLPLFDLDGLATHADLARALDAARTLPAPTILDVAVSWAPELSVPRGLRCGQATFIEAGMDAATRRALRRARQRDEEGAAMVALAGVGRREAKPEDTAAAFEAPEAMTDACLGPLTLPWPSLWMMPAEWRFTPSCEGGQRQSLISAVGAYDGLGQPLAPPLGGGLPLLLAPGVHLPTGEGRVQTGADLAADLAAAVAARAQLRRLSLELPPLSAPTLTAALYVTGWSTWQRARSMTAPYARGLNLCVLERALSCLEMEVGCDKGDLIRCLGYHNQGEGLFYDARAISQCEPCVTACLNGLPPAAQCQPSEPLLPLFSEAYFEGLRAGAPAPDIRQDLEGRSMLSCLTSPCPFEALGDQPLLDPVSVAGRPTAGLAAGAIFIRRPHLTLTLRLMGSAPPAAAWLLVETPGRGVAYLGLDVSDWRPGALIFIEGVTLPEGVVDLNHSRFDLRLITTGTEGAPLLTQAPLMMNFTR
ncbi:hypothetical protein KKF91_10360 [Myxococcota bacterium]|nr:hypothetical protein [Myxococcota bacterium]MBU1430937.1 hypothetical protein [Myxococcota bacterium]MBU1899532.1 hypothetical protein [Myxococcota bacterium]